MVTGDIDRRGLSDPLDTDDVAINRYRLEPDERFTSAIHTHMDQEEVFVVVQECPECGNENMQAVPGDDGMRLVCPECETELAGA